MLSLGGLAFASPWLLAAIVVLPALWWLLRVTPPNPVTQAFPAIRLLAGLVPPEETPARTPLWLILLRMLLVALVILALAHPLLNPSVALPGDGPLLLVVDDGWAAAEGWAETERRMAALIDRAEREGRQVTLVTTAPGIAAGPLSLMRPEDARREVQALAPKPWPADRAAAALRLQAIKPHPSPAIYWLSDGLDDKGGAALLMSALERLGTPHLLLPLRLPHLLSPGPAAAQDLGVTVKRATEADDRAPLMLRAEGADGRMLGEAEAHFQAGRGSTDVAFPLPVELRNRVDRIVVAGEADAGATLLLDERSRRRPVGIANDATEGGLQPLLSDQYYIERALQPFAELRHGTAASLIGTGIAMLVLPDGDAGTPELHAKLQRWVEAGGVLLRFAGPILARETTDDLLPVTLRQGDRTIGGAMSWENPAHLAAFPEGSPFDGLAVPADVTVSKQVLAEPSVDLAQRSWARLTDGTPLVTGEKRGRGWVVLVHTSANTEWSNLALSGLFVDMLRRLGQLAEGVAGAGEGVLRPWQVLDGFGQLIAAPSQVQPIAAGALDHTAIGPTHPPGLYGTEDAHRALNLWAGVPALAPLDALPPGYVRESSGAVPEIDLRPGLLGAALALLLADLLLGYHLRGLLGTPWRRRVAAGLMLLLPVVAGDARAEPRPAAGPDAAIIEATSELRLAYVRTGDEEVDRISRAGLMGLDGILSRRTAVETGEPMAVDVEKDELIFFPLIYWPLTQSQPPLSGEAVERINRYLATGGTILFDTRNQGTAPDALGSGDTAQRLNGLLAGVHVPPLVQIPPDHVLTKSFYLMQDFPGRWLGGTLWVEPAEDRVNDGVSTVILGSNDWAAAWAVDAQGFPTYPVVPGGEAQREQAYRFGVNLVMYALTGNYKADQVHVPAILERLGQ